jgi:hypothetical protein
MRALGRSMRNLAMISIYVRVHGLNGAACLVPKVKRTFVLPLRLTGKTTVDAKLLAGNVNGFETTETAISHVCLVSSKFLSNLTGRKHHKIQRLMIYKRFFFALPVMLEAYEIVVMPRGTFNDKAPTSIARKWPCNHSPVDSLIRLFRQEGVEVFGSLNWEPFAAWGEAVEEECVGCHLRA